jgi:poly(ADP-ribose) glycohydrolase
MKQTKITFQTHDPLTPKPRFLTNSSDYDLLLKCTQDVNHILPTLLLFSGKNRKLASLDRFLKNYQSTSVLCKIASLALRYLELFPYPLRVQKEGSLVLSRIQIGCIIANGFFCTFQSYAPNCQSVSFEYLYTRSFDTLSRKLECILHYFCRLFLDESAHDEKVTFLRRSHNPADFPLWANLRDSLKDRLSDVQLFSTGSIEDDDFQNLKLDFANCYIGGGVLGNGFVQEEILFLIMPELLASLLFSPMIQDNECVLVHGVKRYSIHQGYANTFKWVKDCDDNQELEILVIDAMNFNHNPDLQYSSTAIYRELNKAFIGFEPRSKTFPITTGNWGCGVFCGDPELKFLIQWIAASYWKRPLRFFTFGNKEQEKDCNEIASLLISKGWTQGQLIDTLLNLSQSSDTIFESLRKVCLS